MQGTSLTRSASGPADCHHATGQITCALITCTTGHRCSVEIYKKVNKSVVLRTRPASVTNSTTTMQILTLPGDNGSHSDLSVRPTLSDSARVRSGGRHVANELRHDTSMYRQPDQIGNVCRIDLQHDAPAVILCRTGRDMEALPDLLAR